MFTADADIPVRIESKFKNARLYNAIAEASVPLTNNVHAEALRERGPIRSFCKFHGLNYQTTSQLLSLRIGPIGVFRMPGQDLTRGVRPICEHIAAILERDVAWLFPAELYAIEWPRQLVRNVPLGAMERLAAANHVALPAMQIDHVASVELRETMQRLIGTLSPREAKILTMTFGLDGGPEHTAVEIGHAFGVTGERIRQIMARALRHMRHPTRSKHLQPHDTAYARRLGDPDV